MEKELNKILMDSTFEPIFYTSTEPIQEIISDASTTSMFSNNKKLIIVKNHEIFSTKEPLGEFIDTIKFNEDCEFLFIYETNKLNVKNELISFLLEYADSKEYKKINQKDMINIIKDIVADMQGEIDNKALISLSSKLPVDLRIVFNEIEKLLLENNKITYEMVEVSINKYLKDDYFALSNAITSNDHHGIIESYRNHIDRGDDASVIIGQISSILSLALQVHSLRKQGLTNQDISDKLKIHIFRVKKALELINSSNKNDILSLIKTLAELDSNIKKGLVEPNLGLEVYLIKLIQ